MHNPILQIVMRYVHIVSAVLAVGGLAFIGFCLLPAMRLLDEGFRDTLMKLVRPRFMRILWIAIGGLVVSGVYNWILFAKQYGSEAMKPLGNALIGTKVLLALALFSIVWAESVGWIKPTNPRRILIAKLHMGLVIILIAAVLRYFRLKAMAGG